MVSLLREKQVSSSFVGLILDRILTSTSIPCHDVLTRRIHKLFFFFFVLFMDHLLGIL